ncbi:glycosyltransferase [Arthrobacter sp. MI7-26]|uniref:glycosyltransferase family 2 protein n=1 Tax=Arthrobacter sp. MI7-26 TaxID=2993653 RepID=UPI002248C449|nr:glycosyltransferase family 2 protein [Arthrobacter sp. MI7-26]MCX2749788.1 glycosyltransferase [Arthrobacter sp. MI7-26]
MQSMVQRRRAAEDGRATEEVSGGRTQVRDTPREVRAYSAAGIAAWAAQLGSPAPEAPRSRRMARTGGIASIAALLLYLTWRITFTMPLGGWDPVIAWTLVTFEALPLLGLVLKSITLWNIDCHAPEPVAEPPNGMRVAVLIPTYNEPVEVLAPTIAAACDLQPSHETWVLDDGSRPWVEEMCASFGARFVTRAEHDHAKAGNMNHALDLMAAEEAAGKDPIDIIAVLDCDHVPLPTFLTATLGWFADEEIALVQGPQAFYNSGAFDDDGISGEQGLFFNVLMPSRNVPGAGPFWCGSTSLLRVKALREVGGVATETITEDMHTTLKLIRIGWKTVYHHQTLAVGLAPATADQYLLQRRRWGMGAMQILTYERLWAAKSWMTWRNFHEYLNGTLWWLEGIATLIAFIIPMAVMISGAQTSTADPLEFTLAFGAMFWVRLWGAKRLMRHQIHWPTAFALRIFRVPVGMACLWWLVSRKTLEFQVTPKGAAELRLRGRAPRVLLVLIFIVAGIILYAAAGVLGWVPWRTSPGSTIAAGVWLVLAGVVLVLGTLRIRAAEFATSRRNAHRATINVPIVVEGVPGELLDISMGGAAVRVEADALPDAGRVHLVLPGAKPIALDIVRVWSTARQGRTASLQVREGDWNAYRSLALWLFHTPDNALPGFPAGVPAIAARESA